MPNMMVLPRWNYYLFWPRFLPKSNSSVVLCSIHLFWLRNQEKEAVSKENWETFPFFFLFPFHFILFLFLIELNLLFSFFSFRPTLVSLIAELLLPWAVVNPEDKTKQTSFCRRTKTNKQTETRTKKHMTQRV